jgi:oligopeptide/dipeptide ABC transporter ATP-binding protein
VSAEPALAPDLGGAGERPLLEIEDLVVRYAIPRGLSGAMLRRPHRFVHAVSGVSLSVRRGEMVALVGESGCGKTTTAQAILRLVRSDSGSVRFDGTEVTTLPSADLRRLRRRMQIIYQDPYESLDPRFRVSATVAEPLLIHRVGSRSARRAAVEDALERVGLSPPELFADRFPHELSGGQRQRVAIAASLVLEPDLLVADEPVSMLDVSVRAGILSILDDLRDRGMAVLMITHDLSTAARFADRICVMYLGRIVEEGSAHQVVESPCHPYTQALLSVVPRRDPRRRVEPQILRGETPNPIDVPKGCRFHPRCPLIASGEAARLGIEERCRTEDLVLREVGPGHSAACYAADRLA